MFNVTQLDKIEYVPNNCQLSTLYLYFYYYLLFDIISFSRGSHKVASSLTGIFKREFMETVLYYFSADIKTENCVINRMKTKTKTK